MPQNPSFSTGSCLFVVLVEPSKEVELSKPPLTYPAPLDGHKAFGLGRMSRDFQFHAQ
jgi:hypothetical protein